MKRELMQVRIDPELKEKFRKKVKQEKGNRNMSDKIIELIEKYISKEKKMKKNYEKTFEEFLNDIREGVKDCDILIITETSNYSQDYSHFKTCYEQQQGVGYITNHELEYENEIDRNFYYSLNGKDAIYNTEDYLKKLYKKIVEE